MERFVIPPMAEKALRNTFRTFHGIWHENKISGPLLEEAVYRALDYDATLSGHLLWKSQSHNSKADIRIEPDALTLGLSIKSGQAGRGQRGNAIIVSGHRLQGAWGDYNRINKTLCDNVSDVTICFVHSFCTHTYECLYVDAEVFAYPDSGTGWTPRVGSKNGRISEVVYTSPGGLHCAIKHAMSCQIWWTIPRSLCRQGAIMAYGY
jgi:uncharacterized Fe-S cluster protein YjdI